MKLTEDQKATVSKWIAEGASLSEVQTRLRSELGFAVTYMEARLLMAELNLTPVEKKMEKPARSSSILTQDDSIKQEAEPDEDELPADALPPSSGSVKVTIDQITKPNALLSGSVTFSDGKDAEWMLDSLGRIALNPSTPGYRPTQSDVTAFQMELQRLAKSQGF